MGWKDLEISSVVGSCKTVASAAVFVRRSRFTVDKGAPTDINNLRSGRPVNLSPVLSI